MSNKKMITQEEIDRILEYMNEHYDTSDWSIRYRVSKMMHGHRTILEGETFKTDVFLSLFNGDIYNHVGAYLKSKTIQKVEIQQEGCTIEKELYSLEELKELESKANELEQFTLNLGLWKNK